jgi:hypothetical protein
VRATEWSELATKADLRELEQRFDRRFAEFEHHLTEHVDLRVKATVGESTRLLFFSMLASQATMVGLVLAAVKLG